MKNKKALSHILGVILLFLSGICLMTAIYMQDTKYNTKTFEPLTSTLWNHDGKLIINSGYKNNLKENQIFIITEGTKIIGVIKALNVEENISNAVLLTSEISKLDKEYYTISKLNII